MQRLRADQPIQGTEITMLDFWQWAYSSPLVNVERGVLAEYLVGCALDVVSTVRIPWDAFDLVYKDHEVEVKSSAYIQGWKQPQPTTPIFTISAALEQTQDATGKWVSDTKPVRHASVYVFALFAEKDREKAVANVLDVAAWEFYVLSTGRLDTELGTQKRVGIGTLSGMTSPVAYTALRGAVDEAIDTRH